MKAKMKETLWVGGAFLFLILAMGFMYGWFLPARPSVILHIAPNLTEIKGFAYARHSGSMACLACVNFVGIVKVFYEEKVICEATDSFISLGEVIIAVRCDYDFADYEGENVTVYATGSTTPAGGRKVEVTDNKTLELKFIKK